MFEITRKSKSGETKFVEFIKNITFIGMKMKILPTCVSKTLLCTAVAVLSLCPQLKSLESSQTILHPESRIAGGKNVSIIKHPYTLAIYAEGDFGGAGVLLTKKWALTTGFNALFYLEEDIILRAGVTNIKKEKGRELRVQKIVTHPNYTMDWANNVALLKLKAPVKTSRRIKTIKLSNKLPRQGSTATVNGWGSTSYMGPVDGVLREANARILHYRTCKQFYKNNTHFTDTSFCTSKNQVGPCPFDFGDPLVYRGRLIGLFSGSRSCGDLQHPAVYADVTKFARWIEDTLRRN